MALTRPTSAEALRKAADLLTKQGRLGKGPMREHMCIIDALGEAVHGMQRWKNPPPEDGYGALRKYLGLQGGDVSRWNDAPERTLDEAVKALRDCADSLDNPA